MCYDCIYILVNGGFIHQRPETVRDTFGKISHEVYRDVEIEPPHSSVTHRREHGSK